MHGIAQWFWWANVLICAYCTLYWRGKRRIDGTPGLMTAGGQVWAWQLIFCFVVLTLNASPWHLFWLGALSIVLSIIISKIWRGRMLAARYSHVTGIEFEQRESWIEVTAAEYLADEMSKTAFFAFLKESPVLKKEFHNEWGLTLTPERPLTRGRLAIIFNRVGVRLASSGDYQGYMRSLACSSLFIKGNPLTWASNAEASLAFEDRAAAKWAEKVIKFRLQRTAPPELQEFLSTEEAKELLKVARRRMKEIIDICESHPSWRDTSSLVEQMGVADSYFDR